MNIWCKIYLYKPWNVNWDIMADGLPSFVWPTSVKASFINVVVF